eukprot:208618-Chlamydomonas_euryale.AAC.1
MWTGSLRRLWCAARPASLLAMCARCACTRRAFRAAWRAWLACWTRRRVRQWGEGRVEVEMW